jgi:hypothetical protein
LRLALQGILLSSTGAIGAALAQDQPAFSVRTQLVQLTVRPAAAPAWLRRDWRPGDFSIIDNGRTRDVAFFRSILVPLDLVVMTSFGGVLSGRELNNLQRETREGLGRLTEDDRSGGVSAQVCRGDIPGLVARGQPPGVEGSNLGRRPGSVESVQDPLGCAVRLLTRDESQRAKAILVFFDGRAQLPEWEKHLKAILANGIALYVCGVRTAPKQGVSRSDPRPLPPLPRFPPPFPPGPPPRQRTPSPSDSNGVPLDGLDRLVDVSGGTRVTLDPQRLVFADLVKSMKDAMLVGYYPPDEEGWHDVQIDLNTDTAKLKGANSYPRFFHRTRYFQEPLLSK